MRRFIKPNWKKSNLNISATLAKFLGAPNKNATLPILKKELQKDYKNVVFICADGMGMHPLKINLPKSSFLRKNIKQTLLSTFPSTTTNATTSLCLNKYPLEHGWFGWSLYFKKIDRSVDIYLHKDSKTHEVVDYDYPIEINSNCYFDFASSDYEVYTVLPAYVKTLHEDRKIVIENEFEMVAAIKDICQKEGKHFIYSYLPEPDYTMHEYGVTSPQAKAKIESINNNLEKLYNELNNTLIIVTADHGQIDIKGYVNFYEDVELYAMLKCEPFLDGRTPAFIVKDGKAKEFEKLFKKRYGKDFKLYRSADLVAKGYFGPEGKYAELLGDYIAIGTYTHKLFMPRYDKDAMLFKGHHTSLTEEMQVPLILLAKK